MFIKVGGDEGDEISKNFFISEFGCFPYMKKFYSFFLEIITPDANAGWYFNDIVG